MRVAAAAQRREPAFLVKGVHVGAAGGGAGDVAATRQHL